MTYVELIVVLAIFAILSTVAIFNYGNFQERVNIKNLASDIALKIVEAQKSSISGKLNAGVLLATWKPSYGVYFNLTNGANTGDKVFYYFVDLDARNQQFDPGVFSCPNSECLEKFNITKGNTISELRVYYVDGTFTVIPNDLHITFTRPDSRAIFRSSTAFTSSVAYAQITIRSPKEATSTIKAYASGRIQVN